MTSLPDSDLGNDEQVVCQLARNGPRARAASRPEGGR
jgi:hypothetical protein